MQLFRHHHLLLLDLHSSGVSFYLAKQVRELPALAFTDLTLLTRVFDEELCRDNVLADDQAFAQLLQHKLTQFDLQAYLLVFLLHRDNHQPVKQLLSTALPLWQRADFVERAYFYNFYLLQKQNFSPVKLTLSLFADCVELTIFEQERLLHQQLLSGRNLSKMINVIWQQQLVKHQLVQPDCCYIFTHNQADQKGSRDLAAATAAALKLEPVIIDQLP